MSAHTFDRERLVKLCGMFGSDHAGERENAAAAADKLVRQAGLQWTDIIRPALPLPDNDTIADRIGFVLGFLDALNDWERCFVVSLARRRRPLTEKQLTILCELVEKCLTEARSAA